MAIKNSLNTSFSQNFYCKISIDENDLIPQNIISCTIREWVFDILPRIELQIQDDGAITEALTIQDDSILSIEMGVDPEDANMIDADFNILDKTIDVIAGNKETIITLTGVLKVEDCFYPIKRRSFSNSNSINVVKTIAGEMGLKFVPEANINVADVMTWLQLDINHYDMLMHILKHLYEPKSTCLIYGNIQNELKMTSLKNEIDKDQIIQAKYSVENYTKYKFENPNDEKTIWYKNYNFINYTNHFNRIVANGIKANYYDLIENKTVNVFNDSVKLSEGIYRNSENCVQKNNFGILSKNVFNDYYKAIIQNEYWKYSFFGISLALGINPLYPVKLFDKIEFNAESLLLNERNEVQSGEYLVAGITHNISKNSNYTKIISLHRNGDNQHIKL